LAKIDNDIKNNQKLFVAIDGDAAAGKTTLAAMLKQIYDCNVLHMDDFYLPLNQRTPELLAQPGGNIDLKRFETQVLTPLLNQKCFTYRPFNCATQSYDDEIAIAPKRLTVVEGAYALHPALKPIYDIAVFVKIDAKQQAERVLLRNGVKFAERFKNEWIPMEKRYQAAFDIEAGCDFVFD